MLLVSCGDAVSSASRSAQRVHDRAAKQRSSNKFSLPNKSPITPCQIPDQSPIPSQTIPNRAEPAHDHHRAPAARARVLALPEPERIAEACGDVPHALTDGAVAPGVRTTIVEHRIAIVVAAGGDGVPRSRWCGCRRAEADSRHERHVDDRVGGVARQVGRRAPLGRQIVAVRRKTERAVGIVALVDEVLFGMGYRFAG